MLFSLKTKEETIPLIEGIADELELINKSTYELQVYKPNAHKGNRLAKKR